MIRAFTFLAIFSIAMVVAMVRFMSTFVSDDPNTPENRTVWGMSYLVLWVGIGYALRDLIRQERDLVTTDWTAIALAPVAWLTMNAMWVAAWGALEVQDAHRQNRIPSERSQLLKRQGSRLTVVGLVAFLVLVSVLVLNS